MHTGTKVATFRERFNQIFDEKETNNTALAKELNVSNQTISAWRIGSRSPKVPTVVAIADYFNVALEWLLGFDVPKEAPHRDVPIVIPNSEMFTKIVHYMSHADYVTVMEIFDKTYKKMREMGVINE